MNPPRIFVAGHKGMVGSAITRELQNNIDCEIIVKARCELNLSDQASVMRFFTENSIDQVYLAAAKVGGIAANNNYPTDFILDNLNIQNNVIGAAHSANVHKLLFLGSSCIYPRMAPQPIKEEYLLTGALEPTNEPYAIAKIAGIKLCESINRQYARDYRCIMPTNLYGPGDSYHPQNSHVIPALMQRFHNAKTHAHPSVCIWGTGKPQREFLYVEDLAKAAVHIMNLPIEDWKEITLPMQSHINVGTGKDISIYEVAKIISKVVNYDGEIFFDTSYPDGTPRKLLDITKALSTGWAPIVNLEDGLRETYISYLSSLQKG